MANQETTQPETGSQTLAEQLAEVWDTTEEESEDVQEAAIEPESVEETVEAETEADEPEIEAASEEDAEDAPDDPEPVAPLEHWADDLKDQFQEMPDEAKSFVLAREKEFQGDYTRKTQDIAEIRKAFEPYRQMLDLNGITESQAIKSTMAAQAFLQSNPEEGIKRLARSYGIEVNFGTTPEPAIPEDDPYLDPAVKDLRQQVAELKRQLGDTSQQIANTDQQSAMAQIEAFKTQTDEAGDLAHPHFDKLREQIGLLVQGGNSLEDAYSKAVWSLDEYRDEQAKKIRADAEKAASETGRKKAAQAKKRARGVKPAGKAPAPEKSGEASVKSMLEAEWDELTQ